jgi:hypothetical protein
MVATWRSNATAPVCKSGSGNLLLLFPVELFGIKPEAPVFVSPPKRVPEIGAFALFLRHAIELWTAPASLNDGKTSVFERGSPESNGNPL